MPMSTAHAAQRVPRAAARSSASSSARSIASLSRTFELHGFANIETRVVEPLDRLAKGGEIDKEIYVLRRLQADETRRADHRQLGLHFDLTVPFARYVLENAGQLEFPFRRYQIQPAWRGERPQEGRYRQFTQADVDIVGRDELPFHHDVEVMRVMVEALGALPLPPLSLPGQQPQADPGLLPRPRHPRRHRRDPADRQARQAAGRDASPSCSSSTPAPPPEQAQRCLELATIRVSDTSFVERVRALGVSDELLETGLAELAAVLEGCADVVGERVTVEANLRIARGLDYYTGTVVEIFMAGYERLKSVGGGGRYDALADDGRTTYPGVGISFGVSRTLVPLIAEGVLTGSRAVPSAVLVALADEESRPAASASPTRCAPAASRARSPPARRSTAARSGTPSAAASRSSGSPPPTARRPGQGHPLRRPGRGRPGRPGSRPTDRTCDRRLDLDPAHEEKTP